MSNKEWATIDIGSKAEDSDDELEIEVVEDAGDGEKKPKDEKVESDQEVDSEAEEKPKKYKNRTEERIRKLIDQNKELTQKLQAKDSEVVAAKNTLKNTATASLTEREKSLKEALESHRNAYKDAADAGDTAKQADLMLKITEAQVDLRNVEGWKTRAAAEPEAKAEAQYDPKARDWTLKHGKWFNVDKVMTAAAFALDQELKAEGFDPRSDAFYNEIEDRLSKEFPTKSKTYGLKAPVEEEEEEVEIEEEKPRKKSPTVSSGKGRAPTRVVVRLSEAELGIAKKFGMTPEEYAREKRRLEAGDTNGYNEVVAERKK